MSADLQEVMYLYRHSRVVSKPLLLNGREGTEILGEALFGYDIIQKFNETEMMLYKYLMSNTEKIPCMTIRELAAGIDVSTSTVLGFSVKKEEFLYIGDSLPDIEACNSMGVTCLSVAWDEKANLLKLKTKNLLHVYESVSELSSFLRKYV